MLPWWVPFSDESEGKGNTDGCVCVVVGGVAEEQQSETVEAAAPRLTGWVLLPRGGGASCGVVPSHPNLLSSSSSCN